jgi:ceramide glucosyltransferase
VLQPVGWFASIVTHTVFWGLAAFVATGGSPVGAGFLAAAVAVRLGTLHAIMRMLRERDTPRHLWMVPVKDLAFGAVWIASWLGSDVVWSGRRLRVRRDGRMVPTGPERPTTPRRPSFTPGETHAA